MKKLLLFVLLLPVCLAAQQVPSAPQPKHEALKFLLSASAVAGSGAAFVYAIHDGARQCQAEDNRSGAGRLHGTAPVFGLEPHTVRALIPGLALLGSGAVLEFTGHRKAAKRVLLFGSAVQFGVAGATQWAGCN